MKTRYAIILCCMALPMWLKAQIYCSPTFANGCFNWNSMSIDAGSLSWTLGSDCTANDFTNMSTTVAPGDQLPMTVTNGVWCGVSVWVDFDQDLIFQDSENLFHNYIGGQPSYTYNFDIDIPMGTPNGTYRMRMISQWGSDGFTTGSINGFGPCGSFQYGNFQDFTLIVDASTTIAGPIDTEFDLVASPNPTSGIVHVQLPGTDVRQVVVRAANGMVAHQEPVPSGQSSGTVDLSACAPGVYFLEGVTGGTTYRTRILVH
ncbi:MAG: T9SS type A sorting domain-containing protein [Flavobacteriales bacterium]|nr:T9SS type A sorting domain-containing protein [Flavobacteriales bacterium]